MTAQTQELVRLWDQLPEDKQAEVTDFARFLLARANDEAWEQALADPRPRPKLDAFLESAAREPAEPMDLDRL
jgi:hypothetical protein